MRNARIATRLGAALSLAAVLTAMTISPALAHEERPVGGVKLTVGWVNEPTYTGLPNAVLLKLTDGADQPIADLGDTMKVEVSLGEDKTEPMAFEPVDESPGEYHAGLIPTRPGAYTMRFFGTVRGEAVDQSFTASEDHTSFAVVEDPSSIEFPAKDPSRAELAQKLDRLEPRLQEVTTSAQQEVAATKNDADDAKSQATIALILGFVAIVTALGVGVVALGRRRA